MRGDQLTLLRRPLRLVFFTEVLIEIVVGLSILLLQFSLVEMRVWTRRRWWGLLLRRRRSLLLHRRRTFGRAWRVNRVERFDQIVVGDVVGWFTLEPARGVQPRSRSKSTNDTACKAAQRAAGHRRLDDVRHLLLGRQVRPDSLLYQRC